MSVLFKSPLSSANTNSAFVSKLDPTTFTNSILELLNADPASGAQVLNAQLEINKSRLFVESALTLNSSDQIVLPDLVGKLFFPVQGNSGSILLNSLPFSYSNIIDGCTITLFGLDNTNNVSIIFNDSSGGCLLNGNATLGLGNSLTVQYIESIDRFIEVSRNF
jgi:hypothetical protein